MLTSVSERENSDSKALGFNLSYPTSHFPHLWFPVHLPRAFFLSSHKAAMELSWTPFEKQLESRMALDKQHTVSVNLS